MVYIRPTAVYKFSSLSTDPQQFHHIIMLLSADYKPCNITSNRAILPEKLICKNSHFPPMYTDFFNEKVGYFIVSAEPAVHVLEKQVEEVTSGTIPKKMLSVAISAGVALAVGVAMIRVLTGISILCFVGIGYAAALLLSFFVPEIFTSIAFDSGGVASGTMTSAFLLPLAVGASFAMGGNIITDAFGVIAMVALFPTITIQVLGLIYKIKIRRFAKEKEISGEQEIIEFHSVPQKIRRKVSAVREKGALHGKHATPPEYPDIIEFENEGRW